MWRFIVAFDKKIREARLQKSSYRTVGVWRGDSQGIVSKQKKNLTVVQIFNACFFQIAEMVDIPTGEVAVRWQEIEGSKLNPILAAIQMFRDIFLLWLKYAIGAWKLAPTKKME